MTQEMFYDKKNKKYNNMFFRIRKLEEEKRFEEAFKACMIFIQILNLHIVNARTENSILEFIKYYKMNKYDNLHHIMKKILVIYEKYPSDFVELDYKNLKYYTIKMIEEINKNGL